MTLKKSAIHFKSCNGMAYQVFQLFCIIYYMPSILQALFLGYRFTLLFNNIAHYLDK